MYQSMTLVAVPTGNPSFSKKDKARTDSLLAEAGASHLAGRVSKRLFPDDQQLLDINKANQAITQYHHRNTAAWASPYRIIQNSKYPEFRLTLDQMIEDRKPLVKAFIANYEAAKQEARQMLGDLYDPTDYQGAHGVEEKFYQYVDVIEVPVNDWRVEAAEEHQERIRQDAEASRDVHYKGLVKDHYKRLLAVLTVPKKDAKGNKQDITYDEYLRSGPKRFHKSRIDDILASCRFIKDMNLTNDATLEQLADDIEDAMGTFNIETLKHDPGARECTAEKLANAIKASDIANKVASYLD